MKGKKEDMATVYEEKTTPIKNRVLEKMYELRTILADLVNSSNYVQLKGDGHAVNMTEDTMIKICSLQKEVREAISEWEWIFKIHPDKSAIPVEDIKICAGVTGFLDQLNLEENLKIGKINSDGTIEK